MNYFFKKPLYFLFLLSPFITYAKGDIKILPSYIITKNEVDRSLKKSEALFLFTFKDYYSGDPIQAEIKASCNGIEKTIKPNKNGNFSLKIEPGKYKFMFFYNNQYYEIITDSIKIKPSYRVEMTVNFESSLIPVISDKPVIYVYPKTTTAINIKLKMNGELLFTYPNYEKNGWDFIADPNGTLHINNNDYQYLFWEGTTNINASKTNWTEGFIIDKKDLLVFLENKLSEMGLNGKEKQDYITYWYPLMSVNEKNYIHFLFNEEFNEYANLTINPKPENIFRVYMIWSDATGLKDTKLINQKIPVFNREGFSVLEWGGTKLKYLPSIYGL